MEDKKKCKIIVESETELSSIRSRKRAGVDNICCCVPPRVFFLAIGVAMLVFGSISLTIASTVTIKNRVTERAAAKLNIKMLTDYARWGNSGFDFIATGVVILLMVFLDIPLFWLGLAVFEFIFTIMSCLLLFFFLFAYVQDFFANEHGSRSYEGNNWWMLFLVLIATTIIRILCIVGAIPMAACSCDQNRNK